MKQISLLMLFIITCYCTSCGKGNSSITSITKFNNKEFVQLAEKLQKEEEKRKNQPFFLSLFSNYQGITYKNVVLQAVTDLYGLSTDHRPVKVSTLSSGTKIVIIGETQVGHERLYGGFYLILIEDDCNKVWSGWISKQSLIEKLDIVKPNWLVHSGAFEVSGNLEYLAYDDHINKAMKVIDQKGNVIVSIPYTIFEARYNNIESNALLGWSSNDKYFWFYSYYDMNRTCFGMIDIQNRSYLLFDLPKYYQDGKIIIDYSTGEAIYSDSASSRDVGTADQWEKESKVFNLYKYNFFVEEPTLISSNVGRDFILNKDVQGRISYEKP